MTTEKKQYLRQYEESERKAKAHKFTLLQMTLINRKWTASSAPLYVVCESLCIMKPESSNTAKFSERCILHIRCKKRAEIPKLKTDSSQMTKILRKSRQNATFKQQRTHVQSRGLEREASLQMMKVMADTSRAHQILAYPSTEASLHHLHLAWGPILPRGRGLHLTVLTPAEAISLITSVRLQVALHIVFCIYAAIAPTNGCAVYKILYFIGFGLYVSETLLRIQGVYMYFRSRGNAHKVKREAARNTMMAAI